LLSFAERTSVRRAAFFRSAAAAVSGELSSGAGTPFIELGTIAMIIPK
jgi:hypothetical protein